jgi:hypothetical protein
MLRSGDPNHESGDRPNLVQPSSDLLVIRRPRKSLGSKSLPDWSRRRVRRRLCWPSADIKVRDVALLLELPTDSLSAISVTQKRSLVRLSPRLQPRTMTFKETAAYWGLSGNTFRKLMQRGYAPGPPNIPSLGRFLFDRGQQDRAIDALRHPRPRWRRHRTSRLRTRNS